MPRAAADRRPNFVHGDDVPDAAATTTKNARQREKEKEEQHTTLNLTLLMTLLARPSILNSKHSSNETTATTTTTTTTLTSKRQQLYPTAAWTISTSPAAKLPEENVEKQEQQQQQSQPTAAALFVGDDDDILWNADSEDNFSSSSSPSKHSISLSLLQNSQPPIELIVKPRSKVVLPCELEGNYTSLLMLAITSYRIRPASWLHGGVPVDMITIDTRTEMSGTGHRYIGDSSTAALHIDNVRLEDDGVWKCQIEDDRGRLIIGKPVKLIVLDIVYTMYINCTQRVTRAYMDMPLRRVEREVGKHTYFEADHRSKAPRSTYLLIDGRRLDPGNQFIPVKEGSDLRLECAVEGGNPAPILAWNMQLSQATLENPEPLPDNLTIDANTSLTSTSASLKVLRGHHNATIVCVARHLTLTVPMTASILLDVQYDGAPPVEQSEDGWLNFTKISRTDKGWYKCYTRHMLGIYTSIGYYLNVRFVPEAETQAKPLNEIITSDPRKIEVRIGGDVTLDCDGGCWGRGPSMTPAGGPGRLTLSKVVYQDAGEYRCVAPDRNLQGAWRAQLPYEIKVTVSSSLCVSKSWTRFTTYTRTKFNVARVQLNGSRKEYKQRAYRSSRRSTADGPSGVADDDDERGPVPGRSSGVLQRAAVHKGLLAVGGARLPAWRRNPRRRTRTAHRGNYIYRNELSCSFFSLRSFHADRSCCSPKNEERPGRQQVVLPERPALRASSAAITRGRVVATGALAGGLRRGQSHAQRHRRGRLRLRLSRLPRPELVRPADLLHPRRLNLPQLSSSRARYAHYVRGAQLQRYTQWMLRELPVTMQRDIQSNMRSRHTRALLFDELELRYKR
ncbi:unnamed protein product [Trichogramma brassicae]|uniref:Ig-like domain-containing protein n=1 Tax=Trichogramma brassicae TaxID=86971 RepID=A0A6H5IKD3_9HYME|nr:unnamed protein product [Trichogramma brassicae]